MMLTLNLKGAKAKFSSIENEATNGEVITIPARQTDCHIGLRGCRRSGSSVNAVKPDGVCALSQNFSE